MKLLTQRKRKKLAFGLFDYPTRKLRGEPSFLIVGAEKAGTTSLFDYVNQHPEVAVGHRKEVQYFSRYFCHSWDWYRAHFPLENTLREKICGEASPYYLFHPLAAERIHGCLPQCKILILLREPVARSISQYYHEVAKGREHLSLPEAFETESQRLEQEFFKMRSPRYVPFKHEHFSYIAKSSYVEQVERYFAVFPRSQVMVIQSEVFFRETPRVVKKVFEFLGVDPTFVPPNLQPMNVGKKKSSSLPADLEQELRQYFAVKNAELYKLLGEAFDW